MVERSRTPRRQQYTHSNSKKTKQNTENRPTAGKFQSPAKTQTLTFSTMSMKSCQKYSRRSAMCVGYSSLGTASERASETSSSPHASPPAAAAAARTRPSDGAALRAAPARCSPARFLRQRAHNAQLKTCPVQRLSSHASCIMHGRTTPLPGHHTVGTTSQLCPPPLYAVHPCGDSHSLPAQAPVL